MSDVFRAGHIGRVVGQHRGGRAGSNGLRTRPNDT